MLEGDKIEVESDVTEEDEDISDGEFVLDESEDEIEDWQEQEVGNEKHSEMEIEYENLN